MPRVTGGCCHPACWDPFGVTTRVRSGPFGRDTLCSACGEHWKFQRSIVIAYVPEARKGMVFAAGRRVYGRCWPPGTTYEQVYNAVFRDILERLQRQEASDSEATLTASDSDEDDDYESASEEEQQEEPSNNEPQSAAEEDEEVVTLSAEEDSVYTTEDSQEEPQHSEEEVESPPPSFRLRLQEGFDGPELLPVVQGGPAASSEATLTAPAISSSTTLTAPAGSGSTTLTASAGSGSAITSPAGSARAAGPPCSKRSRGEADDDEDDGCSSGSSTGSSSAGFERRAKRARRRGAAGSGEGSPAESASSAAWAAAVETLAGVEADAMLVDEAPAAGGCEVRRSRRATRPPVRYEPGSSARRRRT